MKSNTVKRKKITKAQIHNELVRIGADLINSTSSPKAREMIKQEWTT